MNMKEKVCVEIIKMLKVFEFGCFNMVVLFWGLGILVKGGIFFLL